MKQVCDARFDGFVDHIEWKSTVCAFALKNEALRSAGSYFLCR